jgi:hypothetical protein
MGIDKLLQPLPLKDGLVYQRLEAPHLFRDIGEILQRACQKTAYAVAFRV